MDLESLAGLGLPVWLFIVAAILFIAKQVGLLDWSLHRLNIQSDFDRQQAEAKAAAEQSEQVALWQSMVRLQTKALDENALLLEHIITVQTDWQNRVNSQLAELIERQQTTTFELRQMAAKFTVMVGIIEQQYQYKHNPDTTGT